MIRRRIGETVVIAGEIEIEVMELSPSRVRLGVRAPREISVVRKETLTVADENRQAAGFAGRAEDVLRLLSQRENERESGWTRGEPGGNT